MIVGECDALALLRRIFGLGKRCWTKRNDNEMLCL
jgi:hypothetical protein